MKFRLLLGLLAVAAALGLAATEIASAGASTAPAATAGPASPANGLPPIRHVFVIVLENESAATSFPTSGPAPSPYLADTMVSEGAFLPNYYGIGHNSNPNYIAMISGQAPNTQNSDDCVIFDDFLATTTPASYGQQPGSGCVYPADIPTIANQLDTAGLSWRSYNQDMGADPAREASTCGHPAVNSFDNTQSEEAGDAYATRHDPFVYFHSIIDNTAECASHVVNLDQLQTDLASAATTPNYVFITPNLCEDGHDATCKTSGENGGFTGINDFLSKYVPMITSSPAFKQQNGLLITTFDEASTSDASSCCGEIPGPGESQPGLTGSGGGRIGAVLLSPCITPGTVSETPYNHYSMLGSVENIFGLPHLGYAQLPGETYFGSDVFTRSCDSPPTVSLRIAVPRLTATGASVKLPLSFASPDEGVTFALQERQLVGARAGAWRTLHAAGASATFNGRSGATYAFRLQGTNQLGIASAYASQTVVIPTVAKPAGARLGGHWAYRTDLGSLRGRAEYGRAGATYRYSYTGAGLKLVATKLPAGGRVRVSLDGVSRVISAHAATHTPQTVVFRGGRQGHHRLTLTVLSGQLAVEGLIINDLG